MEDLFSAPATGTQNTTMDEECQVEEGVSRRRTVEGHHVSEDNEDYLQRTYGVKSTQYCFRREEAHLLSKLLLKSGQVQCCHQPDREVLQAGVEESEAGS